MILLEPRVRFAGSRLRRRRLPATIGEHEEEPMATAEMTPKDHMLQAIEELPDDSSYEEILRELAFTRMVERGLADSEAGRTISHGEMGRRIASWAK